MRLGRGRDLGKTRAMRREKTSVEFNGLETGPAVAGFAVEREPLERAAQQRIARLRVCCIAPGSELRRGTAMISDNVTIRPNAMRTANRIIGAPLRSHPM